MIRATEPTPTVNSWGRELLRALIHACVGIVVTVPTCIWAARGVLADITQRLAMVERSDAEHGAQMEQLRASIVPRTEWDSRWQAADGTARDTREDVREIRAMLHKER